MELQKMSILDMHQDDLANRARALGIRCQHYRPK